MTDYDLQPEGCLTLLHAAVARGDSEIMDGLKAVAKRTFDGDPIYISLTAAEALASHPNGDPYTREVLQGTTGYSNARWCAGGQIANRIADHLSEKSIDPSAFELADLIVNKADALEQEAFTNHLNRTGALRSVCNDLSGIRIVMGLVRSTEVWTGNGDVISPSAKMIENLRHCVVDYPIRQALTDFAISQNCQDDKALQILAIFYKATADPRVGFDFSTAVTLSRTIDNVLGCMSSELRTRFTKMCTTLDKEPAGS